jgi:hypothetical protein
MWVKFRTLWIVQVYWLPVQQQVLERSQMKPQYSFKYKKSAVCQNKVDPKPLAGNLTKESEGIRGGLMASSLWCGDKTYYGSTTSISGDSLV